MPPAPSACRAEHAALARPLQAKDAAKTIKALDTENTMLKGKDEGLRANLRKKDAEHVKLQVTGAVSSPPPAAALPMIVAV